MTMERPFLARSAASSSSRTSISGFSHWHPPSYVANPGAAVVLLKQWQQCIATTMCQCQKFHEKSVSFTKKFLNNKKKFTNQKKISIQINVNKSVIHHLSCCKNGCLPVVDRPGFRVGVFSPQSLAMQLNGGPSVFMNQIPASHSFVA